MSNNCDILTITCNVNAFVILLAIPNDKNNEKYIAKHVAPRLIMRWHAGMFVP